MTKHWVKAWVEILTDPKVARLPDSQWRKFIEVILLAGYADNGGALPPLEDIAWILHQSEAEIEQQFQALVKVGIVHKNGSGWIVTNFEKRQETPAAERMRRMRAKQREQLLNVEDNTGRNSDGNSYGADSASASASASLIKLSINSDNEIKQLYGLYEAEIGTITKNMANRLGAAWNDYPHDWFEFAFAEASRNNVRNWAYVEAILKRWKADGFQNKNGKPRAKPKAGVPPTEYTAQAVKAAAQAEYRRQLKELEAKENAEQNHLAG